MQIKSISLENLKGQNETYHLEKANLFIGATGAGKSSIQQAASFLINGYLSDGDTIRKTAEEIFKLASADAMGVVINTDKGSYTRGIKQSVKQTLEGEEVKYSKTADVSNKFGEKTATELSNRITSDFGVDPSVLNFSEFAKLSAAEQKKYIFGLYPPNKEEWTVERITDFLTDKLGEYAAGSSEAIEQVANKCVNESVNAAVEFITSKFNEFNAQKKKDDITLQNLTQIRQSCEESVKGLAVAEKKRDDYNARIATLSAEIESGKANNKAIDDKQINLNKLLSEKEQLKIKIESANQSIKEYSDQLEKLNGEYLVFDPTEIEKNRTLAVLKFGEIAREIEEKNATFYSMGSKYDIISDSYKTKGNNAVLTREAASKSESIIKTLAATLETICKFDGTCPINCNVKCKTDMRPAIAELEAEIDRNKVLYSELVETHSKQLSEAQEAEEELKACEVEIEKVKLDLKELEKLWEEESLHIANFNQSLVDNEKHVDNENERKRSEINTVQLRKENAAESLTDLQSRVKTIENEIDTLNNQKLQHIEIELLETEKIATDGHIKDLNSQIKAKVEAKTNLENLSNQEQAAEENKAKWQSYKFMKEAIGSKGLAGKMIIDAITPMLTGVQENLDALRSDVTFYIDTENFNFGWIEDGKKHSYETLSNGETLILTTAIVIEFMQKTCTTKILLVDNLNDVDETSASKVIEGIAKLQNKYDLAIMASNNPRAMYKTNGGIGNHEEIENLKVFEL